MVGVETWLLVGSCRMVQETNDWFEGVVLDPEGNNSQAPVTSS